MSIQDLGALGELLAAIATLLTLIYLALQIRQNSRNLQESTSASMNQGWASINARISSDPQFASIFIRGRASLDDLDAVETEQFRALVQDILNMAVYADGLRESHYVQSGLRESHYVQSLHFDAFQVVGSLYQTCPGVREVIDSLEPSIPRDLVQRFRQATPDYAFLEKSPGGKPHNV
jgi:hypothetical protein